jgi:hypothetical protein
VSQNWRQIDLANWESRVPVHTSADGYPLAAFDDAGAQEFSRTPSEATAYRDSLPLMRWS